MHQTLFKPLKNVSLHLWYHYPLSWSNKFSEASNGAVFSKQLIIYIWLPHVCQHTCVLMNWTQTNCIAIIVYLLRLAPWNFPINQLALISTSSTPHRSPIFISIDWRKNGSTHSVARSHVFTLRRLHQQNIKPAPIDIYLLSLIPRLDQNYASNKKKKKTAKLSWNFAHIFVTSNTLEIYKHGRLTFGMRAIKHLSSYVIQLRAALVFVCAKVFVLFPPKHDLYWYRPCTNRIREWREKTRIETVVGTIDIK